MSKWLRGLPGCFDLHPGICSRKKDAVQCPDVLVTYVLPDELTIHADQLKGGFLQPRQSFRDGQEAFQPRRRALLPKRGFLAQRAGCSHRFGTSLAGAGVESARFGTDGPNGKGEKEKVSR